MECRARLPLSSNNRFASHCHKFFFVSRFRVEFVDIEYYFKEFRHEIDSMKPFLCSTHTKTIPYVSYKHFQLYKENIQKVFICINLKKNSHIKSIGDKPCTGFLQVLGRNIYFL